MWTLLAPIVSKIAGPLLAMVKTAISFIAAYRSGRNRQAAVDLRAETAAHDTEVKDAQQKEQTLQDNMDQAAQSAPKTRQDIIDRAKDGTL